MANEPGKAVPETILKKRKRDEEWAAKKAATASDTRKYAKEKRGVIFKKAEQYVKEYRQQARVQLLTYSKKVQRSPALSKLQTNPVLRICRRRISSASLVRPNPRVATMCLRRASSHL